MSNTTTHTHIIHTPANEVAVGDLIPTYNVNRWEYAPFAGLTHTHTTLIALIEGDRGVCHPVASWRPAAGEAAPLIPVAQWGNP